MNSGAVVVSLCHLDQNEEMRSIMYLAWIFGLSLCHVVTQMSMRISGAVAYIKHCYQASDVAVLHIAFLGTAYQVQFQDDRMCVLQRRASVIMQDDHARSAGEFVSLEI
jgi:hypothetical protein